ncbi:MAG TPA: EF-hand domain-containing protein [Paraburkholderia sp.]|uniref:EF-hand domain-containing protein n=1 Tax=Paraburkholderia sp. TaxID=1926495 RepID=UPI002C0A0F78|nr:EF-hand domain-containing protein [Paraburkholderia sp.]HTR07072.1 EF-hand domain-containing protein [Paraburkholderia sp.]
MKKMIAALVLCIVAAAVSVTASAQALPGAGTGTSSTSTTSGGARVERMMAQVPGRFAAANTTHDGKLTREQAQAGMPMVAQHFDEIDTQNSGFVTLAQIEDFMRARAAAR